MACGIGVCLGCAIPARSRPYRYVCSNGPVFDAADVLDVKPSRSPAAAARVSRVTAPAVNPASVKLAIETGGVAFRNPVLTASGTFGYGRSSRASPTSRALGGLVTKGISPTPRFGNATPRICETASGMLNSIGLENVGVEGFERDKLPYLRQCGTRVLVNFFGATFDEYVACGARPRSARRRRRAGDERLVPEHQGGRHRVRHRSARARAISCAPAAP